MFAAFGAGIFLATIVLLVEHALNLGNLADLAIGFSIGAITYGYAGHYIRHKSGKENNSNAKNQLKKRQIDPSAGKLSIVGTILDSVPETLFVGIIIALREPGVFTTDIVLFLGNLATVLEAAKLMQKQGIGKKKIIRDWLADFAIVAVAAPVGYFLAAVVIRDFLSIVLGFASGALIVFIAGELISRAYRESKGHADDIAISLGFLIGILLLFAL